MLFLGGVGSKSKSMTSAFVTDLIVFVFQKQLKIATHSNSCSYTLGESQEQQTKGLDFAFCGVCDT